MLIRTLFALLLFLPAINSQAEQPLESELIDRIVAVVNDDVVVMSELRSEAGDIYQALKSTGREMPPEEVIIKEALDRLILEKLQLAEAKKLGLDADEQTLAQAMANVAKKNGMTLVELNETLKEQGIPFATFREEIRTQIVLARLRTREVLNKIQINKAEVDNYLAHADAQPGGRNAFQLQHILIATPEGASTEQISKARNKTLALIEKLNQGDDFHALAQSESAGQQALNGGDLGWMDAEQVPALFLAALAEMERGQIAGPLQSGSGFHIIRLNDYRGGDRSIIKQTHARHILIRTDELTSDEDAENRLNQLYERVANGDDFATLARSHSNDTVSTIKGGDLGWVSPGDLVPAFEAEMDRLPINGVSKPFRSQFGWHIVQVLERRSHDATDEVRRSKAQQALRESKADEAMELYLRRLRDEAYVELKLNDQSF